MLSRKLQKVALVLFFIDNETRCFQNFQVDIILLSLFFLYEKNSYKTDSFGFCSRILIGRTRQFNWYRL